MKRKHGQNVKRGSFDMKQCLGLGFGLKDRFFAHEVKGLFDLVSFLLEGGSGVDWFFA